MKNTELAIIVILALCGSVQAQGGQGTVVRHGPNLPARCTAYADIFSKDADGLYLCTATNTWTKLGSGGGGSPGGLTQYVQLNSGGSAFGGNINVQEVISTGELQIGRGHVTTTFLLTGGTAPALTFDSKILGLNPSDPITMFWTMLTNEGGTVGNWGSSVTTHPPNDIATRRLYSFQEGFNPTNSPNYVNTDHSFVWELETPYTTDQHIQQTEFYFAFNDPAHSFVARPFGITPSLDNDSIAGRFSMNSVSFNDTVQAFVDQVVINTSASSVNGGEIVFPFGRIYRDSGAGVFVFNGLGTNGVNITTTNANIEIDASTNSKNILFDASIIILRDQTSNEYLEINKQDGGNGAGFYMDTHGFPIYIVPEGSLHTYIFGTVNGYNGQPLKLADANGLTVNGATATGTFNVSGTVYFSGLSADTGVADATLCKVTATNQVVTGTGTLGICLGTSSERFKHDINPLNEGLSEILKLQPVSYRYNPGFADGGQGIKYGFTAERTLPTLPDLVGLNDSGLPNTVDYVGIIPVLVKAIQEQQQQIEELRNR